MKHGFIRVAAVVPSLQVGNCVYNAEHIVAQARQVVEEKASVACFPELCLTGYTCQDLFQNKVLLDEAKQALLYVATQTASLPLTLIVGLPIRQGNRLYNCAAVVAKGEIWGLVPKAFLPNYNEFYEMRWFASAFDLPKGSTVRIGTKEVPISHQLLFAPEGAEAWRFGIEICEDLWSPAPPSTALALQGADVVFNLSASNALASKATYRRSLIANQSARCICGYVYAGCGFGESTQDVVFTGHGFVAENGCFLAEAAPESLEEQRVVAEIDVEKLQAERQANTSFGVAQASEQAKGVYRVVNYDIVPLIWEEMTRKVNPLPFVPQGTLLDDRCEEILYIQAAGLAKRLQHTQARKVVLGISGGLDSTLALIVCVKAFDMLHLDRKGIIGVTMPGYGTTNRTYTNAISLMQALGGTLREIDIRKACEQHFSDIGHDGTTPDITFENVQARERTQILMDLSNLENGLVVGTGDLSELALGWATYNGDHMSMYGVNVSIPKTLIRHLVRYSAMKTEEARVRTTLLDIVDTPISPELIPANEQGDIVQKTEEVVGPYELHDFFLYHMLRFGMRPEKIYYLALHAFDGHDDRVGRYTETTIKHWLTTFCRRFFAQQFKRSCLPDGPKVGSCSLSPRGDWRMPSDASSELWLSACETL